MTIRKQVFLAVAVAAAAISPITFRADEGVFRLQEACGQSGATECTAASNYICSSIRADYKEYRCSKGCDVQT
jgi:hypothetical protein